MKKDANFPRFPKPLFFMTWRAIVVLISFVALALRELLR